MLEVRVPKETVNDEFVTVARLPVGAAQSVAAGDVIAELETSKANVAVEAPAAGFVAYSCAVGDQLAIHAIVATISDTPAEANAPLPPRDAAASGSSSAEPLFSIEAAALVDSLGLDRAAFRGRDFVTAEDVRASAGAADPHPRTSEPAASSRTITPPETGALSGESCEQLAALIRSDLFRYDGAAGFGAMCRHFLRTPGFRVTLLARTAAFARRRPGLRVTVYPFLALALRGSSIRYGIRVPLSARIGSGLYIGHWGGIWINPAAIIGRDCNLSQEVSIGSAGKEARVGHPVIGNRVFIGPGAKIAGPIRVGSNVVIAANSLVTSDVPDNTVMVGVPAKPAGSVGDDNSYVTHTDYPET